jgi:hypothetical protein
MMARKALDQLLLTRLQPFAHSFRWNGNKGSKAGPARRAFHAGESYLFGAQMMCQILIAVVPGARVVQEIIDVGIRVA